MKVEIEKSFPMPASAELAWEFLQNIEAVAACMPGAAITERTNPKQFKGTVSVRFGPATMAFRGEVELTHIDPAARTLRLLGKGIDSTGTSGASMELTARVEDTGAASTLVGHSEVSMSGKAAAFGGRMIGAVADQVLSQFAANFAARVAALAASRPPGAPTSVPADAGAQPPADSAPLPPLSTALVRQPSVASASATSSAVVSAPAAVRELNAVALIWAIVRDWLRSLFGKSPA